MARKPRAKRPAQSRRKPVSRPQRAGKAPQSRSIKLRIPGNEYPVESVPASTSVSWDYVLRSRQRWAEAEDSLQSFRDKAKQTLEGLGITAPMLKAISAAEVVEISIPFDDEEVGWESRILPWEFLLSAATVEQRIQPLQVVRHLDIGSGQPQSSGGPKRLIFVESSPGKVGELFSFDAEWKLVRSSLGLKELTGQGGRMNRRLACPTVAELEQEVAAASDLVVHLAGVDLHQGRALLGQQGKTAEERREQRFQDGLYMAGGGREAEPVLAWDLAGALTAQGGQGPLLVACNFYHSASRVAALAVARGAGAAIGFQDVIDDSLAERFYSSFYRSWREFGWNLLTAFREAWENMRRADGRMRGTGIVLWSAHSLLPNARELTEGEKQERTRRRDKPLDPAGASLRNSFAIGIQPYDAFNYSLLHNDERLFENFTIRKLGDGYVQGLQIEVVLYVGTESFPYRACLDMDADNFVLDVARRVRVPLTSRFARSLRESIYTSLFVEVQYQSQVLHRETFRVKLLPVDEWRFDPNDDSRWLASFILPRDPAVGRVVAAAQRYLMALRDDRGAGFDGYQSTDPDAEDPHEAIDLQVRALWAALSFEYGLNYINPPPVFTEASQRLRTPSDVIDGGRGTCIDLALLLAACLEYVDIFPVVFVLKDHAFPGYWRSEESYQEFLEMRTPLESNSEAERAAGPGPAGPGSFNEYEEVMQLVRTGGLVPLETVWLTRHLGYWEAVEAGVENLRSRRDFGALLDVRWARSKGITPLPITGDAP